MDTRSATRASSVATGAVAAGLAYLVVHDGTPVWQLARLFVVVTIFAAAWKAMREPRAASGAAVRLALGALAVPIGLSIAGPHVAKTGLRPMSVAGAAVLVGGVVLLGSGVSSLLRSTPRWWRLPELAVIASVCLLLVWCLGQSVAATNVPRSPLGSDTPADVGLDYRSVQFLATDGVTLSGWYVPSRNNAAVALLHGAGSTRSNVLDHAVVLARHGYGVLLYDARGHGRSNGRAMDFGWFGDRDLGGAVTFLERQPGVDRSRIAAVGMSMGGEQAIGAAASIDAIAAVVAEGATNRVARDKDWLSDEFGLRGALMESAERLTYALADLLTSASPPITLPRRRTRRAGRPVLLIAAGDMPDEPRAARSIQRASPGTVELWVAPSTGHTTRCGRTPRSGKPASSASSTAPSTSTKDAAHEHDRLHSNAEEIEMTDHRSHWPFPPTDGGPRSRPHVVDLTNVLVAIVSDSVAAECSLRAAGYTEENAPRLRKRADRGLRRGLPVRARPPRPDLGTPGRRP